jgi:hypothetical protein
VRWWTKKTALESTIFELKRDVRRLEQQINNLNSIVAAEVAAEAQKNSWGTWLLSPIYKKTEESEEDKERKSRDRQERRIEKDMKERRLQATVAALNKKGGLLNKAKVEIDAADSDDNRKISIIQNRINARAARERYEKEWEERQKEEAERQKREQVERERQAKLRQQQQEQQRQRDRDAAEAARIRAEAQATEQVRQEEASARWRKALDDEVRQLRERYAQSDHTYSNHHQDYTSGCLHGGWWPKVQGRAACPECSEVWTYLLECPSCPKKACPRCQAAIRSNRSRTEAKIRRAKHKRAASPVLGYDWYD